MKYLYFIMFLIVGFSAIYFAYPLYKITGSFDWVEKYLGSGSTITFFRLVGIALVIFSFYYISSF